MEEAVNDLRGKAVESVDIETKVELRVDAYLPANFVQGEQLRMEVYKRIASIENRDDWRDVMDELIDRFGDVPPEAENLLWIALLRGLAARLGIELVFLRMGKLLMRFSPYTKVDGQKLIDSLNRMKDTRLSLRQTRSETLLALNRTGEPEGLMESAVDELENLLDEMKRR